MKAFARIVAEADGRGGTRLAVLHGESPLLLRRTGDRTAGDVTVHLVGGAAGPLRGDDLRLDLTIGPGASLQMCSVAAQLALPGRPGLPPSRLEIRAEVASGGALRWLPEPLIAAAGCDHITVTRIDVATGGALLWREDLVCGRHGEPCGNVRTETTIRYGGSTLYRHDLSVGPAAPGWSGAAVLGDGRAVGTVITAPLPPAAMDRESAEHGSAARPPASAWLPRAERGPMTGDFAVVPLAGPGLLATAVGADIRQVRSALDPLCLPEPATNRLVATPLTGNPDRDRLPAHTDLRAPANADSSAGH